jgi:hypothetical protein
MKKYIIITIVLAIVFLTIGTSILSYMKENNEVPAITIGAIITFIGGMLCILGLCLAFCTEEYIIDTIPTAKVVNPNHNSQIVVGIPINI